MMDLFYGVNRDRNVITFEDNFASRLGKLRSDNNALHAEMTASERYKAAQQLSQQSAQPPSASPNQS
jgi:hypothetical protein